jgi:lincosamide nucleotidyltransferase A/C/D/E
VLSAAVDRIAVLREPDQVEVRDMSFRPSLFYRVTGRLNAMIWWLPLPGRLLTRVSLLVYHSPPMPSELVLEISDALDAAGVQHWIRGGWGVDALVDRQTRAHWDLDIVIDQNAESRAIDAVERLGFARWFEVESNTPLFSRSALRDHPVAGRAVDLHPLDISAGHVTFTTGTIDNRPVPCLSLESQLATHAGYRNRNYRKRRHDVVDIEVLRELSRRLNSPIERQAAR